MSTSSSLAPAEAGPSNPGVHVGEQSENGVGDDGKTNGATNNVIGTSKEQVIAGSTENSSHPTLLNMPGRLSLSDITLNSPSSQIFGTPFATNSSRFEYPFPESSTPDLNQSSSLTTSMSFPSLTSGSVFSMPSSSSQSQSLSTTPPSISHFPTTFPPLADLPNYSPTHPKMRTGNPPVPPGLAKKRGRWSFGLLRRKSNNGSQGSQSSGGSPRSPPPSFSPGGLIDSVGSAQRRITIDSQQRQTPGSEPKSSPTA